MYRCEIRPDFEPETEPTIINVLSHQDAVELQNLCDFNGYTVKAFKLFPANTWDEDPTPLGEV